MVPCGLGFLSAGLENAHGRMAVQTRGQREPYNCPVKVALSPPH